MRPLDPGWIRTPRSLSPVWLWAPLSCSQACSNHLLVGGVVSWPRACTDQPSAWDSCILWATPPCSPLFFSALPCEFHSLLSVPSAQWECCLGWSSATCARGQTWLCQEARTWHFSLLTGIIVLCYYSLSSSAPKFPSYNSVQFYCF